MAITAEMNEVPVSRVSETESLVAPIWAEILQRPTVGPESDFFELGGDSVMMVMILFRVNEELGVELPSGVLSEVPTLGQFCKLIDELRAH